MKVISFNGTGFTADEAVKLTETEFIGNHIRAGFKPELDMASRYLLLKEAYSLCHEALGIELPPPEDEDKKDPPVDTGKPKNKGGK